MSNNLSKFSGVGTVFYCESPNFVMSASELAPELLIQVLQTYLDSVRGLIAKNGGTFVQCSGDAVLAFWHPASKPSHAQMAYDASRSILESVPEAIRNIKGPNLDMAIYLGTGEFGGDIFGPAKQFQIVGAAVSVMQRLSKANPLSGSFIRMSQYTAGIINAPELIQEEGIIERDGLEALKLYAFRPANHSVERPAAR